MCCGENKAATLEQEEEPGNLCLKNKNINLGACIVFFDFDNTITTFDVLDGIIKRFSVDNKWVKLEEAWKKGKIGSKECLSGQLKSVRLSKKKLLSYLDTVPLDRSFLSLLKMLKDNGSEIAILSDSFTFTIKYILRRHGIKGIKIYSNQLRLNKNKLIAKFPYVNKSCLKCANCKKSHILRINNSGKFSIYIGDGLSDICPAQHTDLTFAKGSLLKFLSENEKVHIEFKHLSDVYDYLNRHNVYYPKEVIQ